MRTETAPAPDRALADALLLDGDERAFRELYQRHTPRLFQVALRVVGGSEHDAEDVVQETWIKATEKLGTFRWEAAFGTWLTGIGLNVARQLLRKRGRWVDLEAAPEPWRPPPHDGERIDLERAIALLPAGYRAVLVLHDIEGWKHQEIADQLQMAVGSSKAQLHRARGLLRARLGEPA